ncbi:MAG: replication-associated recombination protein A [Actinomycetota bacterium]|nr:replication-associated recombination protein A [Actinomycetota bacterium]
MDLFDSALEQRFGEYAPLAARMRPRTLDEVVGQKHLLAPGKALRALVESGDLSSIVLWGPAGTGKTTLAHVIAGTSDAHFEPMSAVTSGVADVRKVIEAARDRLGQVGRRTVLFLDEIHRFNKAQQDALLPAVENGWIVLVGATTENPSFEVNAPLMSRSLLFRLESLTEEDLAEVLHRAIEDEERGIAGLPIEIDEDAVAHVARGAGGDARAALNALEAAASIATSTGGRLDLAAAEEALQRRALPYDKGGDWHYDVISAFIKSMRGSDPDAAVYWMARMLDAGEDPRFVARRMVIFASEDVGNADPVALQVAIAAHHALEFVGLPEAKLNLAQAAVYLSLAPKSNASAVALWRAEEDLEAGPLPVPPHIRDSHAAASRMLGAGKGYVYPHDHGGYVEQDYLPEELRERRYFEAIRGAEAELDRTRREAGKPGKGRPAS